MYESVLHNFFKNSPLKIYGNSVAQHGKGSIVQD